MVGEGIDGLLGLLVRMYINPGDAVVTSLGAYPTFNFHVAGFGGRLVTVPYADDREDLDRLLEAARRENAALVYLSNPDNPMGTWWEAGDITRFIEALPETTMLVLDEAYGETGPASAIPPLDARPAQRHQDAHLFKGLRPGRAALRLCHRRDGNDPRLRQGAQPFRRQQDGAGGRRRRHSPTRPICDSVVRAGRRRRANGSPTIARGNGLAPLPSATNFVTIDCGSDGAFALKVLQALIARDVFVRKPMAPGLDRCIRISAGLDREMDDPGGRTAAARCRPRGQWIGQRWRTIGSAVRSTHHRPRPGRQLPRLDARRGGKARPRRLGPQRGRRVGDGTAGRPARRASTR